MKVLVADGKTKECAQDLVSDFREARKNAHAALMDRDANMFRMYSEQMKSFLQLEFWDSRGTSATIISFLTEKEQRNPYQITERENMTLTQRIVAKLKSIGGLH